MMEELKHLYMRFNYSDDKGFIVTVPTGKPKEHLSIGFDNERKEFNIHFTDDSIVEKGALRRNFIFTLSAFRFYLLLRRFEQVFLHTFLNLIFNSKTNLGKLKKNGFMYCDIEDNENNRKQLLNITKNGKKWKFNQDLNLDFIIDSFKPVCNFPETSNNFVSVYKVMNGHLSLQGYLFKFDDLKGLFFVPKKRWYRFNKTMALNIYNYLNHYPLESTLEFRKMMYDRLKHPFCS